MREAPLPAPKSPESASGGAQFWALLVPGAPPARLHRSQPTAQITAGSPGGLCVPPGGNPPTPSQAAACTGRRPSEPEQASDSQLVRDPSPEKPHQR